MTAMEKKDKNLNVPNLRFPEFSGEWEIHKLSEYLDFKNGLNPDAKRFGRGLPFISVMDILAARVICYDNIRAKVEATDKEIECFGVNKGDLLFQRSSETFEDVGRANVYMDNRTAIYGGFVIRGRKIGNYDPLFFKYLLATPLARKRTCRMGAGAQHFNIGQEGLSKISLHFPSIEEQSKIANLFSLIDERVETQKKIIEDLKKLKYAISNKVLHACFCNSDCAIQLSSVLNERKEYNENDGTYPHGSLSKEGVTLKSERYDRDFLVKEEDKKYKVSHYNDICYNPANLKFGVISRNKLGSIIFSPIYVTYEINDKYNSEYIELLVTNYEFIGRVRKFEQGTVYERMAVSSEDFLSYKISFPSKNTQDKIADNVRAIDTKLQNELNILDRTEKQKNYLLSQMFI